MDCEGGDWIDVAQVQNTCRALVNTVMSPWDFMSRRGILVFKKNSAPWFHVYMYVGMYVVINSMYQIS